MVKSYKNAFGGISICSYEVPQNFLYCEISQKIIPNTLFQKTRWGYIQEQTHMSFHFPLVNQDTSLHSSQGTHQHQVYLAGYQSTDILWFYFFFVKLGKIFKVHLLNRNYTQENNVRKIHFSVFIILYLHVVLL